MSRDKGEARVVYLKPCARVSADWLVNTSATSDAGESAGVYTQLRMQYPGSNDNYMTKPDKGHARIGQLTWLTCPPATDELASASASVFCSIQDRRSLHLLCSCAVRCWTRILHYGNKRWASRCPACGWLRVSPSPSLRRCYTINGKCKLEATSSRMPSTFSSCLLRSGADRCQCRHNAKRNHSRLRYVVCPVPVLHDCLAKFFIGERLSKSSTWKSEIRSLLRGRQNKVVDCTRYTWTARPSTDI